MTIGRDPPETTGVSTDFLNTFAIVRLVPTASFTPRTQALQGALLTEPVVASQAIPCIQQPSSNFLKFWYVILVHWPWKISLNCSVRAHLAYAFSVETNYYLQGGHCYVQSTRNACKSTRSCHRKLQYLRTRLRISDLLQHKTKALNWCLSGQGILSMDHFAPKWNLLSTIHAYSPHWGPVHPVTWLHQVELNTIYTHNPYQGLVHPVPWFSSTHYQSNLEDSSFSTATGSKNHCAIHVPWTRVSSWQCITNHTFQWYSKLFELLLLEKPTINSYLIPTAKLLFAQSYILHNGIHVPSPSWCVRIRHNFQCTWFWFQKSSL